MNGSIAIRVPVGDSIRNAAWPSQVTLPPNDFLGAISVSSQSTRGAERRDERLEPGAVLVVESARLGRVDVEHADEASRRPRSARRSPTATPRRRRCGPGNAWTSGTTSVSRRAAAVPQTPLPSGDAHARGLALERAEDELLAAEQIEAAPVDPLERAPRAAPRRWRDWRARRSRPRGAPPARRRGRGRSRVSWQPKRSIARLCVNTRSILSVYDAPHVRALRSPPGDVRLPLRGVGLDVARDQDRPARPAAAAVRRRADGARLPVPDAVRRVEIAVRAAAPAICAAPTARGSPGAASSRSASPTRASSWPRSASTRACRRCSSRRFRSSSASSATSCCRTSPSRGARCSRRCSASRASAVVQGRRRWSTPSRPPSRGRWPSAAHSSWPRRRRRPTPTSSTRSTCRASRRSATSGVRR